jgi:pantoate--beta-alanine ligase
MQIIENPLEMRRISLRLSFSGKSIGFVPTMGALHEGHLSLFRAARRENDIVAVSVFVNPIQFGPKEDFSKYPRTFEEDCSLLEKEKVDILFFPSPHDMYLEGFQTFIDLKDLPNHLCGLSREGHFRGVATVVAKLFNIVLPVKAYFGQKDYQQAKIIERMVKDLNFSVEIRVMPIVRETDGLAMSSRNQYLNPEQRKEAAVLFRALNLGEKLIRGGEKNSDKIISEVKNFISHEAASAKIDYISLAHHETLENLKTLNGKVVIVLAVYIGSTRLIDNRIVE